MWIGARLGHSKPQCFGDPARLEKRLEFRCATRNTTPHDAMHRASMGAPELQSNWPETRKTMGKPLVLQHGLQKANGEDRNRTFGCFTNFLRVAGEMLGNVRGDNSE